MQAIKDAWACLKSKRKTAIIAVVVVVLLHEGYHLLW